MGALRTPIQALIAQIATAFPDNNAGQITPAIMRDFMNKVLQSLFMPDARLITSALATAMPLTATFTVVPVALWGIAEFDDSGDVSCDLLTGRCLTHPTIGGLSYLASAQITGEGALNTQFDFSFGVNGVVPTVVLGSMTTQGAGRDVNIELSAFSNSLPANAFVQLYARAPAGAATLTANYVRLALIALQTWD